MNDMKNKSVYLAEENIDRNNKKFNLRLLTIFAFFAAFISLVGIWYVNNERSFLAIENNKLRIEVEKLQEEIEILQKNLAQNDNPDSVDNNQEANTRTAGNYSDYKIKPGDTLIGISISVFGTERYASQIADLNGLNSESILQVGQILKIPGKNDKSN